MRNGNENVCVEKGVFLLMVLLLKTLWQENCCEKWRKEMRKKSVVDIMWNQWKGDDFTRMICCWKEYVTMNKKSNRQRNRQQ